MTSVRQIVLNEAKPELVPIIAGHVQGAIFTGIFAELEAVFETPALKYSLFPIATLLSAVKVWHNRRHFNREKNKSLGKRASIYLDYLSLLAEIFAISLVLSGITLLSAGFVPLIFGGMITANFLSHLGQTLYHGWKWAKSWGGTKENEKHKAQFFGHARGAFFLGITAAAIILLMVCPVAFGITLIPAVVTAIKIAAASLVGALTVTFTWIGVSNYEKHRRAMKEQEAAARRNSVTDEKTEQKEPLLSQFHKKNKNAVGFGNGNEAENEVLRIRYRDGFRSTSCFFNKNPLYHFDHLDTDDVDDLIRTMEASELKNGPLLLMQEFIRQARVALEKDLGIFDVRHRVRLNADNQLPLENKWGILNLEFQKRKDKLHGVLLLEQLIENLFKPKDQQKKDALGKPVISVGNEQFSDVEAIMNYFIYDKTKANIFTSHFKDVGCIQKLFVIADRFVEDPTLHPNHPDRSAMREGTSYKPEPRFASVSQDSIHSINQPLENNEPKPRESRGNMGSFRT